MGNEKKEKVSLGAKIGGFFHNIIDGYQTRYSNFKMLPRKDKQKWLSEFLINNALYFLIIIGCIVVTIMQPLFLSFGSIMNIISLSAANIPLALGIAGCIILTGTDLSAGRIAGITACISASLLQQSGIANKMFPELGQVSFIVVIALAIAIGALVGFVNGFCVSKFNLHPFIVTLGTQLIVYGALLMYLALGSNNGQAISSLQPAYIDLIEGKLSIAGVRIPNYIFYAIGFIIIMWFIWNKTVFGKNMFAVGSNPEAAKVSGVNVAKTITLVFVLAGVMYGITGFIDGARLGSNSASTGLNYELDAIAACVIGGVSFVGGIGKIRGVIIGVVLLRIIFVALSFLGVNTNLTYIIKGLIILIACAIDMRKYMVKK